MTFSFTRPNLRVTRLTRRTAKRVTTPRIFLHLGLIIWGLASVLPLVWMISASLQTNSEIYGGVHLIPEDPQWGNYVRAWDQ